MADEIGTLTPPATPKPANPLQEGVTLYNRMKQEIGTAYAAAQKDGKKLYVVIGAGHEDAIQGPSMVVECLALDIVSRLDPKHVTIGKMGVEIDPQTQTTAINSGDYQSNFDFISVFNSQVLHQPTSALDLPKTEEEHRLHDRAEKGDKQAQEEWTRHVIAGMPARNQHISEEITNQSGGVEIIGLAHAQGVLPQLRQAQDVNVLAYNASGYTPPAGTVLAPSIAYALDDKNMEKAYLPSVPGNINPNQAFEFARMVTHAANASPASSSAIGR